MAEELETQSPPVAEPPPAPVQAAPPPEPVDESGVPYRNRVAEMKRKLEEQEALNRRYQIEMGAMQQRYQAPPEKKPEPQWADEDSRILVERAVEKKANEIMQRAQISQQLNDPELNTLAQQEYAQIINNPIYANLSDIDKQEKAVDRATIKLLRGKQQTVALQNTQQVLAQAAQAQAAGASLPGTGGGGPISPADDKARFIKKFMEDDIQRTMVREYWDTDPDSEEGQKHLRGAAERAFGGAQFSSSKLMSEAIKQLRTSEGGVR